MSEALTLLLTRAREVLDAPAGVGPGLPSPCISVCRMDAAGWCEGCLRTIDEIAGWSTMADPARLSVWVRIERRALAATATPQADAGSTGSQHVPLAGKED